MENDILVKFALYSSKVKYDIYKNTLLLYDNSNLIDRLPLPGLVFTGIKLEYNEVVKLNCYDVEMQKVEHSIWSKYLFLEFKHREICICSIEFVPKENINFIDKFKPHFVEVTSESI